MRTISDTERREVAEKLRNNLVYMHKNSEFYEMESDTVKCGNQAYRNIASSVEEFGNFKDANYINIVSKLADLIDRPTCRIVHDENRDCDVCTNCSTSFELAEFDYADANVFEGYSYCPKCGAEVVP